MHTVNTVRTSIDLLDQMRGVISGALPDEQKKEKLRQFGKKIFETLRATSLNDGDLFRQADTLKHATDRAEETNIPLVSEITDIIHAMLDPASVAPKEKPSVELLSAQLIRIADTDMDEALRFFDRHVGLVDGRTIERFVRHLGENGAVLKLRQCFDHPTLAIFGDLLRLWFVMGSLEGSHGIGARELLRIMNDIGNDGLLCRACLTTILNLEKYDHLSIALEDKALVDELIGKTEDIVRDAVCSFSALWYMRTGTQEAFQEAFTIASQIRDRGCLSRTLLLGCRELTTLRSPLLRPLGSEEIERALQLLDSCIAKHGHALSNEVRLQRPILLDRLLFETQDAYGRLNEANQTRKEVQDIDGMLKGGQPLSWMVIMRENVREFYGGHQELQEQLEPLMRTMDSAYEIVLAQQAKRYATDLSGLPESEASLYRDAHNKKIACLIDTKLQIMKAGARLLVPIQTTKHAVALELKKTIDGAFTCLLYNTGDGLPNHQPLGGGRALHNKYHPITWTRIVPANLTCEFFQNIFSVTDNPHNTMKEVVECLARELGEEDKAAATGMRAYQAQGLGSCAYKSLAVFLHAALEEIRPGLYDQYKLETTNRLLQRFDAAFPEVRGNETSDVDDLSQIPEDVPLNIAQLRDLRDRAEKTLKRRNTRDATFHLFSQALSSSLPMDKALDVLSTMVDMEDEVIAERFLRFVFANGTESQVTQCLNHPSLAQLRAQLDSHHKHSKAFIDKAIENTKDVAEKIIMQAEGAIPLPGN